MNTLATHPCFSGNCAAGKTGRIHLPVSPFCNIRCRFCARGITPGAPRPGNASRVITPEQAVNILDRARELCPELAVVGVAGPGDPLASDHAVETLALAHARHPHLLTCLSTNGLRLTDYLPRLLAAGVRTLTVTVNAVEPEILARLCGGVEWRGRFLAGQAGARQLIASQREGILLARGLGITVKVNMVLVPGVNDAHVEKVAHTVAGLGASYLNVIPLLPAAEFAGMEETSADLLEHARDTAEFYLPVMRHCRRCRADACGIPGVSDYAKELYGEFKMAETFSHG